MVSAAVTLRVLRLPVKPAGDWVKVPRVMAMSVLLWWVAGPVPAMSRRQETAKGRLTP
jgi:hypothetical protein